MTGVRRGSRLFRRSRVFSRAPAGAPGDCRRTARRYWALLSHVREVVARFDREMRLQEASPGLARLLPQGDRKPVGHRLEELGLPPERVRWWESRIAEVLRAGVPIVATQEYRTSDGSRLLDWTLLPVLGPGGEVESVFAIAADVTARRKAEQDYQRLFDEMSAGAALHNVIRDQGGEAIDFGFLAVNRAFEKLTGLPAGQVVGRTVRELFPNLDAAWVERLTRAATAPASATFEVFVQDVDRHLELTAFPAGQGQFACIFADVTERKMAEQRLTESEERYRTVFGAASDAMFLLDAETGRILDANGSAERLYGYTHQEFLALRNVDISAEPDKTFAALRQASRHAPLRRHRKKDGTVFPVEITASYYDARGTAMSLIGIRDISARVREQAAQEQARHARRLRAVGQLAGSVAHDLQGLLATIATHAELLGAQGAELEHASDDLFQIRIATERAASLARQLLAFARDQDASREVVAVNDAVASLTGMLAHVLGRSIQLELELHPDTGAILIDRTDLAQLVVTLAVHAKSCMPRGGRLVFRSRPSAQAPLPPEADKAVVLELFHSGNGMDSSSPGGDDGLTAVYALVDRAGGSVEVTGRPSSGTTFRLVLPRTPHGASDPSASRSSRDSGESKLVLVVEDDDMVRRNTVRMLIQGGYRVVEAASAQEALVRLLEPGEPFSLVLSDVVMPGMCGLELAGVLGATHPGMKLLFMSGYPQDASTLPAPLDPELNLLNKPFGREELLRKVHGLLSG